MTTKDPKRTRAWDPFAELDALSRWQRSGLPAPWRPRSASRSASWCPPIDVSEDAERLVVTMELAGARKEDVQIECHDDALVIHGEKRSERASQDERRRYVERTFGSFTRSLTLPANIDPDSAAASFRDGVLTIELRKRRESTSRGIAID